MNVVLDTNVWLDWLVFADPSAAPLQRLADAQLEASVSARHASSPDARRPARGLSLQASASTRAEWLDVIGRTQFRLDALARQRIEHRYDALVTLAVDPPPVQLACSDPDDQKFIELAAATAARFLVTRDRALLALARRARRDLDLSILRPDADAWVQALKELAVVHETSRSISKRRRSHHPTIL